MIKYELSVDNRYLRKVRSSLRGSEIKIIGKVDITDCGTILTIEDTREEIKDWCMWNDFFFEERNIVE